MNHSRPNPFKFGNPVEGEFYFPRNELSKVTSNFLENHISVVLIGPRRFGKTSFVVNLLQELEKKSHPYIFFDIFNITSHKDFYDQLLRSIQQKKKFASVLIDKYSWLKGLLPKVSLQADSLTGQPSLEASLFHSPHEIDYKQRIQDIFKSFSKLGDGLVIAIDEFQKISEIDDGGWLEATLRTHMQQLKNASFLFTGSRRGVINNMLHNPSRPLYKSCQHIDFPSMPLDFTDWIVKRFKSTGVSCEKIAVDHLRKIIQDTPNYVQMVCFHLVATGASHVTVKEIDEALKIVVQQNAYAYQTLLSTLTAFQKRTLRLAANEEKQIFSKELLKKYEINSGSALSSSLKALKEKEILDEENPIKGLVVFDDPLFALWLRSLETIPE